LKKPLITLKTPQFHRKCLQKASQSLKKPHINLKKSLNFSGNAFKKNRNLYKSLYFFEDIFKMPHISLKKSFALPKKASWQSPHCHNAGPGFALDNTQTKIKLKS
jgi:hypothetical protein